MGQIRECTICARRIYSLAEKNWNCTHNRQGVDCKGVMRLITIKDRARYVYGMDGSRKMGEFW